MMTLSPTYFRFTALAFELSLFPTIYSSISPISLKIPTSSDLLLRPHQPDMKSRHYTSRIFLVIFGIYNFTLVQVYNVCKDLIAHAGRKHVYVRYFRVRIHSGGAGVSGGGRVYVETSTNDMNIVQHAIASHLNTRRGVSERKPCELIFAGSQHASYSVTPVMLSYAWNCGEIACSAHGIVKPHDAGAVEPVAPTPPQRACLPEASGCPPMMETLNHAPCCADERSSRRNRSHDSFVCLDASYSHIVASHRFFVEGRS